MTLPHILRALSVAAIVSVPTAVHAQPPTQNGQGNWFGWVLTWVPAHGPINASVYSSQMRAFDPMSRAVFRFGSSHLVVNGEGWVGSFLNQDDRFRGLAAAMFDDDDMDWLDHNRARPFFGGVVGAGRITRPDNRRFWTPENSGTEGNFAATGGPRSNRTSLLPPNDDEIDDGNQRLGLNQLAVGNATPITTAPEPATYVMVAIGLLGIAAARRRLGRSSAASSDTGALSA